MATCRQCNLHRPGLNAQGICPSCVRFHGTALLPLPEQRQKPRRAVARARPQVSIDQDELFQFDSLFAEQPPARPALQPAQPDPAAMQEKALRTLQTLLPKLPIRTPEEQARTVAASGGVLASQPSPERLLALDKDGQLSIEQLERILDASTGFGLNPEQCQTLRDSLLRKLKQRGPRHQQFSPLVAHSGGDWWSAER